MKKFSVVIVLSVILFSSQLFAGMADITGPTTLDEGDTGIFTLPFDMGRVYYWQLDNEGFLPGAHIYSKKFNDNGQHTLYSMVVDPTQGTATSQHSFEVTNVAPQNLQDVAVVEISPNQYRIDLEFDDPGINDTHTYKITYLGDTYNGSIPYEEQTHHTFSFTGLFLYSSTQDVDVTVKVLDNDGGFVQSATTVHVTNYAPSVSLDVENSYFWGEKVKLNLTISDPNLGEMYFPKVEWGDGETSNTSINFENYTFNHTYDSPGTYTGTVTVRDRYNAKGTADFTVEILNTKPVFKVVPTYYVYEDESFRLTVPFAGVSSTCDLSIDWDDGEITDYTLSDWKIDQTHTYSDPGTYNLAAELDNGTITGTFEAKVVVKAKELTKPYFTVVPTYYVYEDELFRLTVPFSEEILSYDLSIDWDDGEITDYTLSGRRINQAHTYTEPGTYNVTANVTAQINHGTMTGTFEAVVVVKTKEVLGINYAPVITSWEPCPGQTKTVYFSDDDGETFYIMGETSNGYMIDCGDPDGYDNIAGNADDRPAPSDTTLRLYKVE